MPAAGGKRWILWAVLAALALGALFGWYARIWVDPTPESRLRDVADGIRDRVRQLTH